MHDDDLRKYVEEIGYQHKLVGLAVAQLNASLADQSAPTVVSFAAAQAILTGAAQISKLLWADTLRDWPPERTAFAVNRAVALREIVLPGKNSILKQRTIRNSIEHYDARLDDLKLKYGVREAGSPAEHWAEDDKPTTHVGIIDMSIFDRSQFPFGLPISPENVTYVRHIDPVTLEYTALDQSVSLQDVVDAIDSVATNASRWLAARPIPVYKPGDLGDMSDFGLDDEKPLTRPEG